MNDKLNALLNYDAFAEAEKLTGKSCKDDKITETIGVLSFLENNRTKAEALKQANDTYFSAPLEHQIQVIEDLGFQLVARGDIEGTADHWRIYWSDGVLIFFDTYEGGRLNSGNAYFNYEGGHPEGCSNSCDKMPDGSLVYFADIEIREGLLHNLNRLAEKGKFLPKWVKRPWLWLLHYMDTKIDGYDYKKINRKRIAMLPEEVIAAISPDENER